jgi:hypothetical protein
MEIDGIFPIYRGKNRWGFSPSIYPKIDGILPIYLHRTLMGTCGFERKQKNDASAYFLYQGRFGILSLPPPFQ